MEKREAEALLPFQITKTTPWKSFSLGFGGLGGFEKIRFGKGVLSFMFICDFQPFFHLKDEVILFDVSDVRWKVLIES